MRFYDNLYIGESVKHPERVIRKLKRGAGQLSIYVIALAKGDDQLEIYHCAFLQQSYYRRHPPTIVGISGGYDEAVDIVVRIAGEAVEKNGNCDLKNYLFPEEVDG